MEVRIYIGRIEIEFIYFFCTEKENVTQEKKSDVPYATRTILKCDSCSHFTCGKHVV